MTDPYEIFVTNPKEVKFEAGFTRIKEKIYGGKTILDVLSDPEAMQQVLNSKVRTF